MVCASNLEPDRLCSDPEAQFCDWGMQFCIRSDTKSNWNQWVGVGNSEKRNCLIFAV